MKKLLTLFLLSLSLFSYGQVYDNLLKFNRGKYSYNYNILSKDEVKDMVGQNAYQKVKAGYGLRVAGITCLSVGGAAIVSGVIIAAARANDNRNNDSFDTDSKEINSTGLAPLIMGGTIVSLSGLTMLLVGNKKLRNVARTYNLNNGRQISLAPATTGVGLALKF